MTIDNLKNNEKIRRQYLFNEAIEILYQTMIFLGNGRQVLKDFEYENNIKFTESEYCKIWEIANNEIKNRI